jgi:hypothetical protein
MLYFVTPAWQRFELTAVCLEQRQTVIEELARHDIEARCVVIADDANADIAESLSFDVLRRPNYALARRFNDGIEHAARQGAQWIVPIGSDSWIDPAYFVPLPDLYKLRSSRFYAIAEGGRIGRLRVRTGVGVGPYMIHRSHLPRNLRPAEDQRRRGVDGSTIRGLRRTWRVEWNDLHPWQYVGFRSHPQLNSYDKLYSRLGVGQDTGVVQRLRQYYPQALVERALEACSLRVAA